MCMDRSEEVPVSLKELGWLDKVSRGYTTAQIARSEHLSVRRIQHGVARARTSESKVQARKPIRPPRLVPLFPIGPFTPSSACPHHGPIPAGSVLCCMVCSRSGIDGHPALKRDRLTDPQRDPKLSPVSAAAGPETRKERRKRRFGCGN